MIIEFEGYQLNEVAEIDDRKQECYAERSESSDCSAGEDSYTFDRGFLVSGKKRSRKELAKIFRELFASFPLLSNQEIIARFMQIYAYQAVPEKFLAAEVDMLVDMDTHRVIEQGNAEGELDEDDD